MNDTSNNNINQVKKLDSPKRISFVQNTIITNKRNISNKDKDTLLKKGVSRSITIDTVSSGKGAKNNLTDQIFLAEKNLINKKTQNEVNLLFKKINNTLQKNNKNKDLSVPKRQRLSFKEIKANTLNNLINTFSTFNSTNKTINTIPYNPIYQSEFRQSLKHNNEVNLMLNKTIQYDDKFHNKTISKIRKNMINTKKKNLINITTYDFNRDYLNYKYIEKSSKADIFKKLSPNNMLKYGIDLMSKYGFYFDPNSSFMQQLLKNNKNNKKLIECAQYKKYSNVLKQPKFDPNTRIYNDNKLFINDLSPIDVVSNTLNKTNFIKKELLTKITKLK